MLRLWRTEVWVVKEKRKLAAKVVAFKNATNIYYLIPIEKMLRRTLKEINRSHNVAYSNVYGKLLSEVAFAEFWGIDCRVTAMAEYTYTQV